MDWPPMTNNQNAVNMQMQQQNGVLGQLAGLLNDISQSNRTLQSQIIVGSAGAAGGAQTANPTNVRG